MLTMNRTDISILVGGAAGLSCVCVEMIHTKLLNESDKAIQIGNKRGESIWLPKKALIPGTAPGGAPSDWFKLARWFIPNEYQIHFFEHTSEVSGQSAH